MAAHLSRSILLTADRGHLLRAFANFAGTPLTGWLAPGHPARTGNLPPKWGLVSRIPDQQLVEAVAVNAPNHCIDGWSYASRSMSALLAGDPHASRHLSYYAQLRAALSILSNLGVGVFNGVNFVINNNGSAVRLDPTTRGGPRVSRGLGTHQIVWEALETWVSEPGSATTFLAMMRFCGTNLYDCLKAIYPGIASAGLAGSLIEIWGVDLKRGNEERRYRNISSYSPQAMNVLLHPANEVLDFVEQSWRLFEPTSVSGFDLLDRHILRLSLLRQYQVSGTNQAVNDSAIVTRYDELPAAIQAIASSDFLSRKEEPDDPLLINIAKHRRNPATAVDMLARALLLLRASTAMTISNLTDAGVSCARGELRPWIDDLAVLRGFWAPNSPLTDPRDLWADIEISLDDLLTSKTPPPASLNDWMTRSAKGLPTIAEAERISVWSFGG